MRLCDDVITVFNKRVDPESGGSAWKGTVIRGASWFATDAATVDTAKGGLVAANKCVIRIPEDADTDGKAYVDPPGYAGAEDVCGLWTLADGDVVVKGEAYGEDWNPASLTKGFADCVKVLGVTDNRRASQARHWKVVGT